MTTISLIRVRSSCLRSRSVVVSAAHSRGRSRAIRRPSAWRSASVSGSGRRARARPACRARARAAASASSSLRFEGAGDEPVLGLARVELPLRALGLIFGALHREALAGEQLLVLVLELADRAGGGAHARPG